MRTGNHSLAILVSSRTRKGKGYPDFFEISKESSGRWCNTGRILGAALISCFSVRARIDPLLKYPQVQIVRA